MQTAHRIARQSIELQVDSETAARELYAEMSGSFERTVGPVLDEVFTAACPPDVTLRLDRVEIDAGHVSRDELMHALAAAARDQLEALLTTVSRQAAAAPAASAGVLRLAAEDIFLERIALFLERGAMTWRDARATRADIEEMMLALMERAPTALLRLLTRIAPAYAARRIWTQLTPGTRRKLLEWLRVGGASEIDRTVMDWAVVLAAAGAAAESRWTQVGAQEIAAWMFERVWTSILARTPVDFADVLAGEAFAPPALVSAAAEPADWVAAVFAASEQVLPPHSQVRRLIAAHAARAGIVRRAWTRHHAAARGPEPAGAGDEGQATRTLHSPAAQADGPPADRGASPRPAAFRAAERETRAAPDGRLQKLARTPSVRDPHTPCGVEPLWAAHGGIVILWPFLPGLFEECGLVRRKRFVDEAARERAVLLTAHLADGRESWGEHELLVEKLLCGYRWDAPAAASLTLTDPERQQALELLAAAIDHWQALRKTSASGLRSAFLCREGTVSEIASGWKLGIARAGHDVLLDALPWGIGLVLLPWMEQPLHVEW